MHLSYRLAAPWHAALFLLMFVLCLSCPPARAQEAPDALVKRLTSEILDTIRQDKALRAGDPRRVKQVVEEKILPHADFRRTTAIAVGPAWRQATPEQQDRLFAAFRDLLIFTYSGALNRYTDQKVVFRPFRAAPDESDVVVRCEVVQSGRQPVQLDYRLEKTAQGWKIYDVNVLGAWLTLAYQGSFASEVRRGGIPGLIATLEEKNRQLASGRSPRDKQSE